LPILYIRLIIRVIIFEVTKPDRGTSTLQTDRQTDNTNVAILRFALLSAAILKGS